MSFIRRIPLPMSALALALATLGNLLAPYSPIVRAVCGSVAGLLVALLLLRILLDFEGVRKELDNLAVLAVTPAFFMALMVLATYLKPLIGAPALWLWFGALGLQLVIVVLFVVRAAAAFKLQHVLPSWFLVFVGIVAASVTSPAFAMQPVGLVLLAAGSAGYVAMLALVAYRMVRVGDLPAPAMPTICIFAAPPSLVLAGYLALVESKQPIVVYALLAAAGLSLLYVAVNLPRILKSPFHPGIAALTFPVVISALAFKASGAYLASNATAAVFPSWAVTAFDLMAIAAVAYVLVRYAAFLAVPSES